MKIKTITDIIPSEDKYAVRFLFEEFTDEEKFLFNKIGFISVDIPVPGEVEVIDLRSGKHDWYQYGAKIQLDVFHECKFLFSNKDDLNNFVKDVLKNIQTKTKQYVEDVKEELGENTYEVTLHGAIQKIVEGAKKVLDKNSKEYKEIIEKNREAFEKLSKL